MPRLRFTSPTEVDLGKPLDALAGVNHPTPFLLARFDGRPDDLEGTLAQLAKLREVTDLPIVVLPKGVSVEIVSVDDVLEPMTLDIEPHGEPVDCAHCAAVDEQGKGG